jgi:hypothetical protein
MGRRRALRLFWCELGTHLERSPCIPRTHQSESQAENTVSGKNAKSHRTNCGANQHHQIECVCHLLDPVENCWGKFLAGFLFAPANFAECHSFVSRIVSEILTR